jgi:hypothetical protein
MFWYFMIYKMCLTRLITYQHYLPPGEIQGCSTHHRLLVCLSIFAILNNFSVIWWQSVFIGVRENPDTLYNVFGKRPRTFRIKQYTWMCSVDSLVCTSIFWKSAKLLQMWRNEFINILLREACFTCILAI